MGDTMKWRNFLVSGLCLVALVACDSQKPETKAPAQAGPEAVAVPEAGSQDVPGAQVGTEQAVKPVSRIQGKAKEVLKGGGFTYVLLAAGKGETWVAVPETKVAVGEDCAVVEGQLMQNFASSSLNRTFKEIIFATGFEGKKAEMGAHGGNTAAAPAAKPAAGAGFGAAMQKQSGGASAASPHAGAPETTPGSGKAVVPFVELKIAKASGENACTVAEVFGKAAGLNGKKVKIKAQVVKFSPQIMGKNWLHLQDGTGNPQKNTHDLVVTSAGKAEKGDTVTVEGVLAVDKDFGAGYKYAVIVEDVAITR
ncbi:MAG: DNA-binding protein [Pseudomonadota bacterium]